MTLTQSEISDIESIITDSLRSKLVKRRKESDHMPFHYPLLGKERMALFSFIHSLNTTFGSSIFEPVASKIAERQFDKVTTQYIVGDRISSESQVIIQRIMDAVVTKSNSNKLAEIEKIRSVCQSGNMKEQKPTKADLCVRDSQNRVFLIELKTAKPNKSNFRDFKRTLLEWCAIALASNPRLNVNSLIAIPYNPYEPKPYRRWTEEGVFDLKNELMVGKDFWDFLGGAGAYEALLGCFERAGLALRCEINKHFQGVAGNHR